MDFIEKLNKFISFKAVVFAFFIGNSFYAFSLDDSAKYKQWFTGPVLTPTPITMDPSHPALEVAIVGSQIYGKYDSEWHLDRIPTIWGVGPFVDFQAAFNKVIGIEFIGSLPTYFSKGASSTHLNDSIFRLGFQVSNDKEGTWVPDFRILLQETFPTGKYQKFNPSKNGTDATGQGSFQTGMHLAFQKLFHISKGHDFRLRWTLGYFFPASVQVKGYSHREKVCLSRSPF